MPAATADDNTCVVVGSMNHLTTTDVNAGVVRIDHNVTGLRIGHTCPAHKGTRGAQAAIATSEAIANKTRAVEAVRANSAKNKRNQACCMHVRQQNRHRRTGSGAEGVGAGAGVGAARRSGCRRKSGVAALVVVIAGLATVVGVLGRTGSLVAHRGLLGGAGVDAGLQRGVGLGLCGKLGLQLRIRVYDVSGLQPAGR